MKLRSHIIKRFQDVSKKHRLMVISKPNAGNYAYQFSGKFILVVNELEHLQIQKLLKKG